MQIITRYFIVFMLAFITQHVNAQQDSVKINNNQIKIETLLKEKEKVESEEKEQLKTEVEAINQRLEKNEITQEEATQLKKEAAEKRALNIENRLAIIDNQIALLRRNNDNFQLDPEDNDSYVLRVGGSWSEDNNESLIYFGKKSEDKPKKYDVRTTTDLVFGIGFNNAIIEGQDINDSPYKIGGSGFVELGVAWKTRLFENTNFWRVKYGVSIQWNKFNIKDNQYLVNTNDAISLQEFPLDLDKAKFRTTNLVFPLHLEFGPSRKIERDSYVRYSTNSQLKIGLGGYAGVGLGHMQKLKYKQDGDRQKDKQKGNFNVNEFVYGLSGYVALGDAALYVKYDLNPIFRNQTVDQNNISVGVRFDMD